MDQDYRKTISLILLYEITKLLVPPDSKKKKKMENQYSAVKKISLPCSYHGGYEMSPLINSMITCKVHISVANKHLKTEIKILPNFQSRDTHKNSN